MQDHGKSVRQRIPHVLKDKVTSKSACIIRKEDDEKDSLSDKDPLEFTYGPFFFHDDKIDDPGGNEKKLKELQSSGGFIGLCSDIEIDGHPIQNMEEDNPNDRNEIGVERNVIVMAYMPKERGPKRGEQKAAEQQEDD